MIERLFPDLHVNRVEDINLKELKAKGIKAILLDIDNTIINYERIMKESTKKWIESAKEYDVEMCLLSNNTKKKVQKIGNDLNIKFICNASKPLINGYIKAMKLLKLNNTEIAVVGDQVFTDVYGGNRVNMYTILVEKLEEKDIWITKIKRPMERYVLTKYQNYDYQNDSKRLKWKENSAKSKKIRKIH